MQRRSSGAIYAFVLRMNTGTDITTLTHRADPMGVGIANGEGRLRFQC